MPCSLINYFSFSLSLTLSLYPLFISASTEVGGKDHIRMPVKTPFFPFSHSVN